MKARDKSSRAFIYFTGQLLVRNIITNRGYQYNWRVIHKQYINRLYTKLGVIYAHLSEGKI